MANSIVDGYYFWVVLPQQLAKEAPLSPADESRDGCLSWSYHWLRISFLFWHSFQYVRHYRHDEHFRAVLLLYFKYGRLLVILLQEVLFMQVLQVFCERFRQVEFTELQTTLIQLHKRTICKQFPLLLGDGSWVLSDVIEKGWKCRGKLLGEEVWWSRNSKLSWTGSQRVTITGSSNIQPAQWPSVYLHLRHICTYK